MRAKTPATAPHGANVFDLVVAQRIGLPQPREEQRGVPAVRRGEPGYALLVALNSTRAASFVVHREGGSTISIARRVSQYAAAWASRFALDVGGERERRDAQEVEEVRGLEPEHAGLRRLVTEQVATSPTSLPSLPVAVGSRAAASA